MPDDNNVSALAVSSPQIYIDHASHPSLTADLIELVIEASLSTPSRCLARFNNVEQTPNGEVAFKYFELSDFDFGSDFAVWLAMPPDTLFRLFEGRVNRIEAVYQRNTRPEILLQSDNRLYELTLKTRTRVFADSTDADIIQQIASEYGLIAEINLDGPTHKSVSQLNQTDFAFLAERVRTAGGDMLLDHNKLIVAADELIAIGPLNLNMGPELTRFRVNADLRGQCTAAGVAGWDFRQKSLVQQSADEDDMAAAAGLSQNGGGRTLEAAFGQSLATVVNAGPDNDQHGDHLARVYYRELARRFVTGHGESPLSWSLKVGRKVNILDTGGLFDGTYSITAVCHRFDLQRGLRTEFEVERFYIGETENHQEQSHG